MMERLHKASHEMSFQNHYDFILINDDLDKAVRDFIKIIQKYDVDN